MPTCQVSSEILIKYQIEKLYQFLSLTSEKNKYILFLLIP
ncbi:hypothetical protein JQM34_0001619 [Streptococcus oralis]|uniref:Uncharacterized protein n=2 Tax=Streptococcus oralis TaxID=1303 RepID=I0Q4P6_STROR|nr:hypothetical protein HMPREF9189_1483 [Streptococcus sp. oral taxon 071 str. 73H25AP]EIC76248.1 hypothetical protein HMPREF1115_0366 [Streptococcus oralis SK610]KEQ49697.1 hypothetical protein SK143_1639 [Streptococcus oralis]QRO08152.1 hypothetical protein JQM34_0001619 [Streptococcus oralis]